MLPGVMSPGLDTRADNLEYVKRRVTKKVRYLDTKSYEKGQKELNGEGRRMDYEHG